ncbi:MAG: hypothetical protein HY996_07655 [Micrococcales bacterium]|nr:hypothetical protein [Micrococcales bacterium]
MSPPELSDDAGRSDQPLHPDADAPRAEYVAALFAAVSWGAVVFAADGILAIVLDRDPIPGGVSPYYGLLALAVAGVLVWISLARSTLSSSPVLPAVVASASVYLLLVASGFVDSLRLATVQATSPFALVAAATAAVAVIAFWAGMRAWRRQAAPPTP